MKLVQGLVQSWVQGSVLVHRPHVEQEQEQDQNQD